MLEKRVAPATGWLPSTSQAAASVATFGAMTLRTPPGVWAPIVASASTPPANNTKSVVCLTYRPDWKRTVGKERGAGLRHGQPVAGQDTDVLALTTETFEL
eukprot:1157087-Pelagomonas_calceolata.AAC.13